jgi:hypothetical protein
MSSLNPYESPQLADGSVVDDSSPAHNATTGVIPFAGSYTFADAMEAHHLAWPEAWNAFRRRIIGLSLTIIGGVACTFMAARADNDFVGFLGVVVTVVAGGWLAKKLITFAIDRRRWRMLGDQHQGIFEPSRGEVSRDSIFSRYEHFSQSVQWSAFRAFRSSPNILVLYYCGFDPEYFFMARTKFSSDADWQRVLELAAKKLPRA